MNKFLIETHCHTDETSNCGKMPAAQVVELYRALGYKGIMITDHLHNYTFKTLKKFNPNLNWEEKTEYFLKGYNEACKSAERYNDFKVYLGAELRFDKNDNDYLILGLTKEKLLQMEGIIEMRPEKGLALIKELDCAVVQAHPFRDDCVVMKPGLLDGIEVYNGDSEKSRNDIALEWAVKYNYIMTSGSDFHGKGTPNCGIYLNSLPENEIELRDVIINKKFELKINEELK